MTEIKRGSLFNHWRSERRTLRWCILRNCWPATSEYIDQAYQQTILLNTLKVTMKNGEISTRAKYRLQKERIKELPRIYGVEYRLILNGDIEMYYLKQRYYPQFNATRSSASFV